MRVFQIIYIYNNNLAEFVKILFILAIFVFLVYNTGKGKGEFYEQRKHKTKY